MDHDHDHHVALEMLERAGFTESDAVSALGAFYSALYAPDPGRAECLRIMGIPFYRDPRDFVGPLEVARILADNRDHMSRQMYEEFVALAFGSDGMRVALVLGCNYPAAVAV